MKFDILIAGGGSAGCVLASRLSENGGLSVGLLEAGIDTPPGREPEAVRDTYYSTLYEPSLFWGGLKVRFNADSHAAYGDRPYEQGRVLGGGSAVNAMIGLRGLPSDYDEWGVDGWGWRDVLPYFRKLENDADFGGPLHGHFGPIPIRRHAREQWPGFCRAVAAKLESDGWFHHADMNGDPVNGMFPVPMTSTPEHRVSSAMAYLTDTVRRRGNLTVICNAAVDKVLFTDRRVIGVRAVIDGRSVDIEAGEVIACAGAIHTPALLQRSGVGPLDVLAAAGVAPVVERRGVGANLQDHPMISIACHLKPEGRQAAQPRAAANLGLRYSSGAPGCHDADMYVSVANKGSWHAVGRQIGALVMCLYKPYSRGTVRIASSDGAREPMVDFNLLDDPRDELRLIEAVRLAARIYGSAQLHAVSNHAFPSGLSDRVRQLNVVSRRNRWVSALGAAVLDGAGPLRRWLLDHVVNPGPRLADLVADDAMLRQWVRRKAIAFYHAAGTCRMGAEGDAMSVVDAAGRVYGVSGLRVVDASAIPVIPRANTNLPVLMMAEKISAEMSVALAGRF